MVEAQAAGCQVIAYKKGGVLETLIDGITGLYFEPQTAEALAATVTLLEKNFKAFDPGIPAKKAVRFSKANFKEAFTRFTQST